MKLIDLRGFDVDVSNKLVAINDIRSVVGAVTHNQEVKHSTLGLNVSEEWVNVVLKQCASHIIVELEQVNTGDFSDLSFND